jgi:SecD/SecF fusion protein
MGSSVGDEMLWRSVIAIVAGLVGIFIYLTFRYEMPFAIGGIVAILHDVTVAVGACVIAGKEIGLILIGAFLTIAGYSINDTIVIFDRVRDNLRTMRGDLEEVLNHAISATLSRTLITTLVTGLAVVAMFLFGGKSMADFSFTMLVGMVTGVYSTIFIASPVVLWWAKKRKLNLRQAILDADAARLEALSNLEREAPAKPVKPSKRKGDDDGALKPA